MFANKFVRHERTCAEHAQYIYVQHCAVWCEYKMHIIYIFIFISATHRDACILRAQQNRIHPRTAHNSAQTHTKRILYTIYTLYSGGEHILLCRRTLSFEDVELTIKLNSHSVMGDKKPYKQIHAFP